ncbi:MAG: hypothetical protein HYY42_06835 [Chloroflexi bacterium]|nr:hypothetical protein [Chloroflexota bacterium]
MILALTAFAEASQRVALLVDADVAPGDVAHAAHPDLVVVGRVDREGADRALSLLPPDRPVVISVLPSEVRTHVEERVTAMGVPALLGDRDHRIDERDGRLVFTVRDEPYVTIDAVPGIERSALATGVAAALALGVMGIRMREEWVTQGIATLRAELVAS